MVLLISQKVSKAILRAPTNGKLEGAVGITLDSCRCHAVAPSLAFPRKRRMGPISEAGEDNVERANEGAFEANIEPPTRSQVRVGPPLDVLALLLQISQGTGAVPMALAISTRFVQSTLQEGGGEVYEREGVSGNISFVPGNCKPILVSKLTRSPMKAPWP